MVTQWLVSGALGPPSWPLPGRLQPSGHSLPLCLRLPGSPAWPPSSAPTAPLPQCRATDPIWDLQRHYNSRDAVGTGLGMRSLSVLALPEAAAPDALERLPTSGAMDTAISGYPLEPMISAGIIT